MSSNANKSEWENFNRSEDLCVLQPLKSYKAITLASNRSIETVDNILHETIVA